MPITGGNLLGFSDKYLNAGGSKGMASLSRVVPAPIGEAMTQRVQKLSLEIFHALDCKGVVRVDFMINSMNDNLTITEINAIPGSLAFYLWAKSEPKLSYKELINLMVKSAFAAHAEKNENDIAHHSDILKSATLGGSKGMKGAKG
jgi:D-alanine-D-alanine ligase